MASRGRSNNSSGTRGAARLVVGSVVVLLVAALCWAAFSFFRLFTTDRDRGGAVPVPNVVNLPQTDAEQMLTDKGLIPELERASSEVAPKDVIFQQNPKASKRVRPGAKVHIWVSLGPAHFVVPQLTGKSIDEAEKQLLAVGLKQGEIKKIFDPTLPRGQVVSQQPEAGREFAEPPQIDLLVADKTAADAGPMPDLIGQQLGDVEQLLARAKLHLAKVRYAVAAGSAAGTVTRQNLTAGSATKIGQQVELEVALDPADAGQHDKQLQVQVVVPEGPAQQQVQIKVVDSLGQNVVCNETKAPHDTVSRMVDVAGDAQILIYVRDLKSPWRTDVIPYIEAPPPPVGEPPAGDQPPGSAPPLGGGNPPEPGTGQ